MQVWPVSGETDHSEAELREAALLLASGKLVAFPTETVYGLGANAYEDDAVQQIFRAKGRPSDNPLIVHIADMDQLHLVTPNPDALPAPVKRAMQRFWPGPLTLLLPAHPRLAAAVHPGVDTVGVRIPAHPVARTLLRLAGCPVAAPSANKSGRPSPTTARHVMEDFGEEIGGIVDGGSCAVGLESTVAAVNGMEGVILRPGFVTKESLQEAIDVPVRYGYESVEGEAVVASPGMKYRHYAPNARVTVWWGDADAVRQAIREALAAVPQSERVAVVAPEPMDVRPGDLQWSPAPGQDYAAALGREAYALLRAFDHAGSSHIFIHGVPPIGLGAALMNRLEKASEGRIHHMPIDRESHTW